MTQFSADAPNYSERRESFSFDEALCEDPVLQRLVEMSGNDALEHMMRAARASISNPAISQDIEQIMVEEVQLAASTDHLFPYHTDGVLQEAAEKYADLRYALGAFGLARASWLQDRDNPEVVTEYMQSAESVRVLQQEYDLPVDGSDPLFTEDDS